MACKLRHLDPKKTIFFLCDIQEKFRPAFPLFQNLIQNAKRLTDAGKILEVPLLVTQQYPEKLGKIVKELNISHANAVIDKTKFSMMNEEMECRLGTIFDGGKPDDVILYGLETHVCLEQTAIDLMEAGINVSLVGDCAISRCNQDRDLAFERLRNGGCNVTTVETVLYDLLRDMKHPKFSKLRKYLLDLPCEMEISVNTDI